MAKFPPPETFDFSRPEHWPEWRQRFQRYRTATKLNLEDGDVQVCTLLYSLGKEAEQVYKTFTFEEREEEDDYEIVLEKLDNYFVPKVNTIHERARFHQRIQRTGETAEEYIRTLHELADTCAFGEVKEENIRDRLVIGILDKELSEKLQMMPDLTLSKAVELVRQSEQVKQHVSEQGANAHLSEVAYKRQPYRNKQKHTETPENKAETAGVKMKQHQNVRKGPKCTRCGRMHPKNDKCPARNAECRSCKKLGHFAVVCRSRVVNEVIAPKQGNESNPTYFLGGITDVEDSTKPWTVKLPIQGTQVTFKIDSGADTSVIPEDTFNKLAYKPKLRKPTNKLDSPGGKLNCLGYFIATTTRKDKRFRFKVNVIRSPQSSHLLSRNVAAAMGLIKRMEEIKATQTIDSYPDDIGKLKIKPIKITLREDAVPYSVTTARRVSVPMLPKVKKELDRMVDCGVIQPISEPTEWCAPMVPVPKKNKEQPRICVDLKVLNKAVKREKYVLPTVDDILPKLAGAKVFSLLDAASGFWQIPLDPNSAKLTTFITPFGRYYFNRLPFGITSAPEIFQREMTELLKGHEGVAVYMDDILIYSNTPEEHEVRLQKTLNTLKEAGLKLNHEKCFLRQHQLNYLGHCIDEHGVRPDKAKVKAVTDLETPKNVSDLRRILGMIHYLGRYLPNLSVVTKPLNDLLKHEVTWTWDVDQENAFRRVKELVTKSPVLAFYDVTKPTIVSADASSYGLGGVLLQDHNGQLKPVSFCSRTLTEAEQRYAQIEKECLAAVWACEKFSRFLYGLDSFILQSDHKPLIPLINSKDLNSVPLRCQRLLLRMMRYNPTAVYVPGKELVIADTLSRHPQAAVTHEIAELLEEIEAHEHETQTMWPISPTKLDLVKQTTLQDTTLRMVQNFVLTGWPKYIAKVPPVAKPYYTNRHSLTVSNGLVLYNDRIVMPQQLRPEILQRIHDGHQGIVKCRERAKCSVWWPGLSTEIKQMVSTCTHCQESRPSQKREPLLTTLLPSRPWERVAADICELNKQNYLVVVDYFSRYIELAHLKNMSSETTVANLKNICARWGCPNELVTDNGPQFSGRTFMQFVKDYDIKHITTSPHYPQANGEAERAVQTAKHILRQTDPFLALMIYRSTPIQATGVSPAQLMLGRQIRTTIPTLETKLQPAWPNLQLVRQADERTKENYKRAYNCRYGAKPLPELQPGVDVAVKLDSEKGWIKPASVLRRCDSPRSYLVQTEGGVLRRNRRHLKPIFSTPATPARDGLQQGVDDGEPHSSPSFEVPVPDPPNQVKHSLPGTPVRTTFSGRVVKPPSRYAEYVK